MANYIDFAYLGKTADPTGIRVWEQNYETGKIDEKDYDIKDYLYFYIDATDENKIEKNLISQRGTKVKKVVADNFKVLRNGESAKMFHSLNLNTYESDIEPLHKVMLDNYGKDHQKATNWNLALYDIETDVRMEDSFMGMRANADREINAISVWYSKPNKFYNFTVVPPMLRDEWDFDTIETRGNFEIIYFDNEEEMLETFFTVTKKHETMALGAWNGDFFDTKYIFDRCKNIWKEKGAAERMGRFTKVKKTKIMLGEKEEILVRPIGMIWYDCMEAYKKNGPELESFALNAVVEHENLGSKLDFEGSFETLYHGSRKDRDRFLELTPKKKRKNLIKKSNEIGNSVISDLGLYSECKDMLKMDTSIEEYELETRIQISITDRLEELLKMNETKEDLGDMFEDFERFVVYKKLTDTYRLFVDYSNQDSQLLHDLEMKLEKFKTLMMLAQYNVSSFYDVFSTLKQVEQGITNFAHLYNNKVVIDREYDKKKQIYNKFVDKDLLQIRIDNDTRIQPNDNRKIREIKTLLEQKKIPGANVLQPYVGLISYNEAETPQLAREFKSLKNELREIDEQLKQFEMDEN
jgi:hypothetical protein